MFPVPTSDLTIPHIERHVFPSCCDTRFSISVIIYISLWPLLFAGARGGRSKPCMRRPQTTASLQEPIFRIANVGPHFWSQWSKAALLPAVLPRRRPGTACVSSLLYGWTCRESAFGTEEFRK